MRDKQGKKKKKKKSCRNPILNMPEDKMKNVKLFKLQIIFITTNGF